jgi:hypothetical protein
VFDALFAAGGAAKAHDAQSLAREIMHLWRDEPARTRQLRAARAVAEQGADAFERTLRAISSLVSPVSALESKLNASA